ncbi:MAG TPA: right-handed parallel beta-helix repeat-containing protein, partial [Elusimicrobiales bacterium]|nr:right-handed parallel beta-helix repeat-containing protein [Elusimicrobiales bacterium]
MGAALLGCCATAARAVTTSTYTANGSWTAPAGITSVTAEVWGGGGAGGSVPSGIASDGSPGGGGGAYSRKTDIPVTPLTGYTVTVGAGGAYQAGTGGAAGGNSWFIMASTVLASGGEGGGAVIDGGNGGAGGAAGNGIGDVKYSGGTGGIGGSSYGGPGASSAGRAAAGTNEPDPWTSPLPTAPPYGGGIGGIGGTASSNGSAPASGSGGGGGGAGSVPSLMARNGGAGAGGKVLLTYNFAPSITFSVALPAFSSGIISIPYNLLDDNDIGNILNTATSGLEYSLDNSSWFDCTLAEDGNVEDTDLASSPGGTPHVIHWDSSIDLAGVEDATVRVRMRPNDGFISAEVWTVSAPFGIDNKAPYLDFNTGCGYWLDVAKSGTRDFSSIQAALDSFNPDLDFTTTTCVVIRDTATYSEQVTVSNLNNAGYRLKIMADPTFISSAPAVNPPAGAVAGFRILADSVTVQGINVISTNAVSYGIHVSSADINISNVNIISGGRISTAGLVLTDRCSLSNSSITAEDAHGLWLGGGFNTVSQSTMTSRSSGGNYALYVDGVSSNSFTGSYISNPDGYAAVFSGGSIFNSISQSTITSSSGDSALYLTAASSNTFSGNFIANPAGPGADFTAASNGNKILQSTITSGGNNAYGLRLNDVSSNTVDGSYISSLAGDGVYLSGSADRNTISDSTMTSGGGAYYGLHLLSANLNKVERSNISNSGGNGLLLGLSNLNTISASTITSSAEGYSALVLSVCSSNTIAGSYIQGSTAVYISASTGTVINYSVLTASGAEGYGLRLARSVNLELTSSTFSGGQQGAGIYLDANNNGAVNLSSNVISGGQYGLNISALKAGGTLSITSMTFQSLTAGATAVNFLGGQFVTAFTGVGFSTSNIAVNISGGLLGTGSRIKVFDAAGVKEGPLFEKDPAGYVDWPQHACDARNSLKTGQWSAPGVWDLGEAPTACSAVNIGSGHTVTIDIPDAVSSTAAVNGVLAASRVVSSSWTLVGGNLYVNSGGRLDYGTEAEPLPEGTTAQLVLARGAYPGQYGLIVNNGGAFTVRGSTKAPYAFAISSIGGGEESVTVYGSTSVAGWKKGDTITIGPTSGSGAGTAESRTISGIGQTGNTYTVSWAEGGLASGVRQLSAGTPIIVANLTRNVLVRSSGTIVSGGGGNSAYIRNYSQDPAAFSLAYGEFAYLGADDNGKYGITFDEAGGRGSISSSTVRNGYAGVTISNSSGNNLVRNNFCFNANDGIWVAYSFNNTLAGNNSCANGHYGINLYVSDGNSLSGNNSYSNANYGLYLYNSSNNTLAGNNYFSNQSAGIYVQASDNDFTGNNAYANASYGMQLLSSNNNTFAWHNIYSNSGYGVYAMNSAGNTFAGGRLGYDAAGADKPNTTFEIVFDPGYVETLVLKETRMNPALPMYLDGINMPGSYLLSYNQDYATGTVRMWGNYQVAGSTLTLDYAAETYAAANTSPRLMRGTGHSIAHVTTGNATLSELITVRHTGGATWEVSGSSSGLIGTFVAFAGDDVFFIRDKVGFELVSSLSLATGDYLDFVTIAGSNDSGSQKKLLFGPAGAAYNNGHSKLEVAPSGGIVLRGKPDGTVYTMVDRLAGSTTYYTFVDSGAFTAQFSSFTNMDQGGLQLSGSAQITVSSSTFDYLGFAAGTNAYITARSLASDAVFDNVSFGLGRSSEGYSAYNVWVEGSNPGLNWTFTNPAGTLWGERYDRDLAGRVAWISCGAMTTVQSGSWSAPETWDAANIPSACNAITVAANHTVTIDTMTAVSAAATINGTLMASRLSSSSWTLVGGDINVNPGGWLDYGNEANTIPENKTAHLVLASGTYAGQYGLIVNNGGNFTVRGSTKTPYAFASASIGTGATSLTVYGSTSVAGWQPGDTITIGPTSGKGTAVTDLRTIT